MSIAGVRSNRGDSYQTLVAFDWALTVLSNPDYQWLEVDSVALLVDDVVVGKSDGTKICCQCKKNQIDYKAWAIADLADELDKVNRLLANDSQAQVCFYSRSPFGALAKLREHSTTQADETSYRASLSPEHQKTDAALAKQLVTQTTNLSTYEFLRRTQFETSPELDRMEALLRERLRYMACNPNTAYDSLWTRLVQLGARLESGSSVSATTQHRLTKDDLKAHLAQSGAMMVPIMILAEVRASFASTSAIGRSWHRDIAGERISSPVVDQLLAAIDAKKRSILLMGLPGSGKTCVMLALQEALEQRAKTCTDLVPLFIQSREFADLVTAQDRKAQGLPEQWVEKVARMAEDAQVVVVIDSLDVLSIAREHSVLTYFLAQIDRLLSIPNVTVVTACRDFDRQYDRRIAGREWDYELKCLPLDWEAEIAPFLKKLGIDTSAIDPVTRELIRNPRELALFVELAQREGSFNVVTSQALAQRYLDTIVRANDALGEAAIQAIEAIADEMLKSRSLAVPQQRFTASNEIQRALLSLNVLQKTEDEKLTFGHQTLLDVLVISGAVRLGVTLNQFIQSLPPVPFVRPSIRSFVAQLAIGERREFRKQLRTVLTGSTAFHMRRLVAESFAEQIPQDDDWSLIRDLREKHRDVFQVIYIKAVLIEWHHFWFKHFVPALKDARDAEAMAMHVHRVSLWKNEDTFRVLEFWAEVLALDWVKEDQIARQLEVALSEINVEHSELLSSLLEKLLNIPQQEHSLLGRTVARSVAAGAVEDKLLWRYIAGEINDNDVLEFRFDNKLRCQPHELGNHHEKFLSQRMEVSVELLNLAIQSIERWSYSRILGKGAWMAGSMGFLGKTSYNDVHSEQDIRHIDSENILLGAIETAVLHHAKNHSKWWQENRERLCFSHEGALRYFSLIAFTKYPEANVELISRLLNDKNLLVSDLSYELGTLIHAAFLLFDVSAQDAVMAAILSMQEEKSTDDCSHFWILQSRSELIVTIPRHHRSPELQAMLDDYENNAGPLIRQPHIGSSGGMISAPFSFEVFLGTSNDGVLHLLAHYSKHERDFDDFLIGGKQQVGQQLSEAASRAPTRFLLLLPAHWTDIPECFRDDIMSGVANYLSHRHGNLQFNGAWIPLEEPDAPTLASQILDELERHPHYWKFNRAASSALQACAYVIQSTEEAERLVFLTLGFKNFQEGDFFKRTKDDQFDLIGNGINMIRGHIVEALMILFEKLQENRILFPNLLLPTLRSFAGDEHPSIRALILRRLPYLQSQNPELGWELFQLAMQDAIGLWKIAEPCLYYAYHNHFEKVSPLLARIHREGTGKDLKTWGRISALAALTKHIDFSCFLQALKALDAIEAWHGAATVWTHPENVKQHCEQCLAGIEAGLSASNPHAAVVAKQAENLFRADTLMISVPIEIIRLCLVGLESDGVNKHHGLFGFDKWLNVTSHRDPEQALTATEIYLDYVKRTKPYLFDHENNLTQLLTCLFAAAEEREESDHGTMLKRVVVVQDALLGLGVDGVNDWLKAAERP